MPGLTTLKGGALLFLVSWLVHTADHMRRGVDASPEAVVWVGTFVALLAFVVMTLIYAEHVLAAAAAAVCFPAIAFGVAASHLPPKWGPLSDPILVDSVTDNWSIIAVSGEVLAAAWLGYLAFGVMARNNFEIRVPSHSWA